MNEIGSLRLPDISCQVLSSHISSPFHVFAVFSGMCSAALPFILLGDAFDCVTLDVCEKAFSYVENNVALWTSVFHMSYHIVLFLCLMDFVDSLSFTRPERTSFSGCVMVSNMGMD